MSSIKLTADSGGGTVELKAPATTASNAAKVITLSQNPGMVTQVVSRFQDTQKSTTTSGSFVNVTDVYGTITPASTSNKILVLINGMVSSTANNAVGFRLKKTIGGSSTEIGGADDTATQSGILNIFVGNNNHMLPFNYSFLDSPSTTSEITYQLTWRNNGGTTYWNTYSGSAGADYDGASSVILMEIAG